MLFLTGGGRHAGSGPEEPAKISRIIKPAEERHLADGKPLGQQTPGIPDADIRQVVMGRHARGLMEAAAPYMIRPFRKSWT